MSGRIRLARALYAGFGGADAECPAMGGLVAAERRARARQWGLAIRLAQRLTGGVEAPLKASGIAVVDGRLRLSLDAGWHHLAGESAERRLRVLAQAPDAQPELVLLYTAAAVAERQSVVQGKMVHVRENSGGPRILKKKKQK